MIAAKKILCRHRSVGRRNWAAIFERWLGYAIHPDARRAIAQLERQRALRRPQRLYICDRNASSGILQRTLVAYVRFLATAIRPGAPFCLVGKTRAQLDNLLPRSVRRTLPDPHWQPILATSRTPDHCRGLTFPMALLLDSDAYPRRGRHLSRILSAVNPCLPSTPGSLLVIHGTLHPRARVNTFTNEARRSSRLIPLLDLSVPPSSNSGEASAELPVLLAGNSTRKPLGARSNSTRCKPGWQAAHEEGALQARPKNALPAKSLPSNSGEASAELLPETPPEPPPKETLVLLHIPPDDPGCASRLNPPEPLLLSEAFLS